MVGKATRRRLTCNLFRAALLVVAAEQTVAQDLCANVTIPAELHLACAPAPSMPPGSIAVAPEGGAFANLSRLTIRPLDREGDDDLAWTDPRAWLQRQMTLDTSSFAGSMAGLADDPDSPFSGSTARAALTRLQSALAGVAALPLTACDSPTDNEARQHWDMHCTFGGGGLGVYVDLRLMADGERRWALSIRTANEQRRRHLQAIAGSFQPP